jgi:hypothetical protein
MNRLLIVFAVLVFASSGFAQVSPDETMIGTVPVYEWGEPVQAPISPDPIAFDAGQPLPTAIPEPTTALLLGGASLVLLRRRR